MCGHEEAGEQKNGGALCLFRLMRPDGTGANMHACRKADPGAFREYKPPGIALFLTPADHKRLSSGRNAGKRALHGMRL